MSQNFQSIPGVYSVTAPIEMTQTFVEVQRAVTKVGQIVILVLDGGQHHHDGQHHPPERFCPPP